MISVGALLTGASLTQISRKKRVQVNVNTVTLFSVLDARRDTTLIRDVL